MSAVSRIRASLHRWRWALLSCLVPPVTMLAWAGYYRYRTGVCLDQKTDTACGRFARLESWACDHGVGESLLVGGCFAVGRRYEVGAGIPKDDRQAIGFFRRACVYELGRGCTMAWSAYSEALGTPHEVVAWGGPTGPRPCPAYLPEWARDLNQVLDDADHLCVTDFRGGVVASPEHRELLRRFCSDLPRARAATDDAKAAHSLLLEQCQRQNPRACGLAGQLLAYGVGVKRDLVRGKDLLARACNDGYGLACEDLGSRERQPPMLDNLERAEKLASSAR